MSGRDLLVRGGEVVDGTGAPARRADVRVRGGRVVEVVPDLRPEGEAVIDASDAFVTPGFIDTHAHTDPQVFWDPSLDPEPLHGVTTMLVGNCSLSLFPVNEHTRGEVADLFAYIEDVPRHLFDDSVPWTWTDYAGYRDAVDATGAGTNLAALMGHSPLRLAVMGDAAWTEEATPEQIDQMVSGIVRRLESTGESEIGSQQIGAMVMEALEKLDPVAYVRYASVYQDFKETTDFAAFLAAKGLGGGKGGE